MLHVFFGTNTAQVRQEAFAFLDTLSSEQTEVTKIVSEEFAEGRVLERAQGSGLFEQVEIIILDTPSENELFLSEVLGALSDIQNSTNHFVLIEGSIDAATKKKLTKHAEDMREIKAEKDTFQIFALTDALLQRDKKTLWLLFMEAKKRGVTNEEIIGILFWQIKILRLAEKTKSAEEAGQKPYPYQKAKRALAKFKEGEVDALSSSLLRLYHEGHGGKKDLDLGLEQWVLSI